MDYSRKKPNRVEDMEFPEVLKKWTYCKTASDSLKADITKKIISQELKHIINHQIVKSTGKLVYNAPATVQ